MKRQRRYRHWSRNIHMYRETVKRRKLWEVFDKVSNEFGMYKFDTKLFLVIEKCSI